MPQDPEEGRDWSRCWAALSHSPPPPAGEDTTAAEASLLTHVLRTKLVENKHTVEVQRNDPNSPLYSVKSFEELRL